MEGMRTWIIAVIALIIGAAGGYFYMQPQVSELAGQVLTLETQLTDAKEEAQGAASEIEALRVDLEDKSKLIEDQNARIIELEAASQEATPPVPQ